MAWELITVTQTLATRLEDLRCRGCGRKLEVGQEFWIKRGTRDYYCKGCYKKLVLR